MDMEFQETPMAAGVEIDGSVEKQQVHSEINEGLSLEDELLELYEAFYPNTCTSTTPHTDHHHHHHHPPYPLQHLITPPAPLFNNNNNSNLVGVGVAGQDQDQEQLQVQIAMMQAQQWQQHQQLVQFQLPQQQSQSLQQHKTTTSTSTGVRKKRKRDQMKTVYRVPAQNVLTVDKWAWRKYGQKPIKGSPFPRNYYRCSSSKGCTARKQVERSITEPEVYVVTYSGDHFHPWPIHRNALAGVSRADHRTCVYSLPRGQDHDDQSSGDRHVAVTQTPSVNQLPPPAAESDEEEGEGLLIPNRMYVDEDMLRGMHELGNSKFASRSDPGPASGFGF